MTTARKILCLPVLFLCATALYAENTLERKFIWNEANSRMASAGTQEDFLLAAKAYQKLLDTGVRNGPLFYNLGTALLMAKRYDEAMNAFLRAERYTGSRWDIKRNMLIAAAGEERNETASLPWYRVPMFWHFGLAVSTRMTISVCAFTTFWLSLILRSLGSCRLYRPLMILSLIVLVVFGSSVLTTLESEVRDTRAQLPLQNKQPHPEDAALKEHPRGCETRSAVLVILSEASHHATRCRMAVVGMTWKNLQEDRCVWRSLASLGMTNRRRTRHS